MPTQRAEPPSSQKIHLRDVAEDDLPILFEHQRDPAANEMAAFSARDRDAFMAHWAKIMADGTVVARTITLDSAVAGNIVSWLQEGRRLVGYWIGRDYWGRGGATQSLSQYLRIGTERPLFAYVARRNIGSIRVLEKCGFVACEVETPILDGPADEADEFLYVLGVFQESTH